MKRSSQKRKNSQIIDKKLRVLTRQDTVQLEDLSEVELNLKWIQTLKLAHLSKLAPKSEFAMNQAKKKKHAKVSMHVAQPTEMNRIKKSNYINEINRSKKSQANESLSIRCLKSKRMKLAAYALRQSLLKTKQQLIVVAINFATHVFQNGLVKQMQSPNIALFVRNVSSRFLSRTERESL